MCTAHLPTVCFSVANTRCQHWDSWTGWVNHMPWCIPTHPMLLPSRSKSRGRGGYTYLMMHIHTPPPGTSTLTLASGKPTTSLWHTHPFSGIPTSLGYLPQHINSSLVPTHNGPGIPTPLPCGQTDSGLWKQYPYATTLRAVNIPMDVLVSLIFW